MINKKIAYSAMSILTAMSMAAGATFAFFSSTATSNTNTFASGTLTLLLDDANEPSPAPTVTGSLSIANFMPGQSTSGFISLHNGGTINMERVKMTASATFDDGPDNLGDIRDVLNMTVTLDDLVPDATCTGGTSLTSPIDIEVGDGGGSLTVKEFNSGIDDEFDSILEGVEFLAPGGSRNVCVTVTFDSLAGNTYQGDSADVTFGFTGLQDESQL